MTIRFFSVINNGLPSALIAALAIGILIAAAPAADAVASSEKDGVAFISIPTMTVTLLDRNRIRGVLTLNIALEVEGDLSIGEVEKQLPRLHDVYLRSLSNLARTHLDPGERINIGLLQLALQRATDSLYGSGEVAVLLQDAIIRAQ